MSEHLLGQKIPMMIFDERDFSADTSTSCERLTLFFR